MHQAQIINLSHVSTFALTESSNLATNVANDCEISIIVVSVGNRRVDNPQGVGGISCQDARLMLDLFRLAGTLT